eukprot:COSAG01_NODE_27335_length_688_cov_1.286927_1_plen_33_part_10
MAILLDLESFDCGRVQTVRYVEVYCAMQVAQKC